MEKIYVGLGVLAFLFVMGGFVTLGVLLNKEDTATGSDELTSLQKQVIEAQGDINANQNAIITGLDLSIDAKNTADNAAETAEDTALQLFTVEAKADDAQSTADNALGLSQGIDGKINQLSSMTATSTSDPIPITFVPYRIYYETWTSAGPDPPTKIDIRNFSIPGPNRKWLVVCGGDFAVYPSGNATFVWEKDDVEIPTSKMYIFDTHSGASGSSTEFGSHTSMQFVVEADAPSNRIVWKCSRRSAPNTNVRRPYVQITEIL